MKINDRHIEAMARELVRTGMNLDCNGKAVSCCHCNGVMSADHVSFRHDYYCEMLIAEKVLAGCMHED